MNYEGVININKPAGWTSQDVCAKMRSRLHIKKIGHTGTLDPMATGVLPVCIGNATRIIEYYDMDHKSYHATMKLGIETDTMDITGEVIKTNEDLKINIEDIFNAFEEYKGEIEQIPPKYSAVKINGRRAYELAREGIEPDIKPRKVKIYSNKLINVNLAEKTVEFDVECSKGTYIRTMISDIGRRIGCGATMTALVRTGSGRFKLCESIDLARFLEMSDDEISARIIPADSTISNLGSVHVNDEYVSAATHGNFLKEGSYYIDGISKFEHNGEQCFKIYGRLQDEDKESFIGIGVLKENGLQPKKVIV